ncbi:hypothetical protein KBZ10_14440 [Streptomyces sp. F63]|uniref:hypothetical protein n=1 Tax=Streptomyces sp. F63 TaxID=2824887 RepID=UPI001B385404|nr:hypothetical protein [Streptomyces sp. F63]MBQ0985693.1 hypothetical protein [Streptomyces sp. F63]
MWRRFRGLVARRSGPGTPPAAAGRPHNLFEAAAYVAAGAENDDDRAAEAADWVSPEALSFGVAELAGRAVVALARERGESPHRVARALLGLPGE